MQVRRPSARARLAVTALLVLLTSLALLVGRGLHVNVPAGLVGPLVEHGNDAAVIVNSDDDVAQLRSLLDDQAQLPSAGPPFMVATVSLNGAGSWCSRLVVRTNIAENGDIRVVPHRPWWVGRLPGADCTEDVPAPGAVITSIDAAALAAAGRLTVGFGGLGDIICLPQGAEPQRQWTCGGYPGLGPGR